MPDSPNVGAPASGSYGEGKAGADLKSALPAPAPQPGPGGPPPQQMNPNQPAVAGPTKSIGRPAGPVAPPGVPQAVMGPTAAGPQTPGAVPGAPMLNAPGADTSGPGQAQYLTTLDMLANSPNVSPKTRTWARTVIGQLTQGA